VLAATLAALQVSSLSTAIPLLVHEQGKRALTKARDGGFAIHDPEVIDAASTNSARSTFSTFMPALSTCSPAISSTA